MKKKMIGTVKKVAMTNSATVIVDRIVVHPKYKKRSKKSTSYIVHNELKVKPGDKVELEETRPISRHKHFKINKIIKQ